jgi:hypothetical protein
MQIGAYLWHMKLAYQNVQAGIFQDYDLLSNIVNFYDLRLKEKPSDAGLFINLSFFISYDGYGDSLGSFLTFFE